jgi:metal-dependent hydrolase (beta-lactamase superfamily II)
MYICGDWRIHLSGKIYEDIIDPTLAELVKLDAIFIVPCHCTDGRL